MLQKRQSHMTEYVNVRASETLGQGELVAFLKSRFTNIVRLVGRTVITGTECVEVRVPSVSPEFDEIRRFVQSGRAQSKKVFDVTLAWYLRKYTRAELEKAEVLCLWIPSHFEPSGEECGTVYHNLCEFCNLGAQASDLILDTSRIPQHKDISETIALVEWVVSRRLADAFER